MFRSSVLITFALLTLNATATPLSIHSCQNALLAAGQSVAERILGITKLVRIYEAHKAEVTNADEFWQMALRVLEIQVELRGSLEAIPPKGSPLVIVSNHPFGMLDGIVLSSLVSQRRDDYLVLANSILGRIPEIGSRIIALEILQGDRSERARRMEFNKRAIARASKHLTDGGALIVFPAGSVATSQNIFGANQMTVDEPWQSTTGKLLLSSKASGFPVYMHGRNSALFHLASRAPEIVRSKLRVGLLPRELLNKRGSTVTVSLGEAQPYEHLVQAAQDSALSGPKGITELLRRSVYDLVTP